MSRGAEDLDPKLTVKECIQELDEYIRRFRVDCYDVEWARLKECAIIGEQKQIADLQDPVVG